MTAQKPIQMEVERIRVGERDREELGDVAGLAESIRTVGLLHPVVVTADGTLVAGGRRLAAIRRLGWPEVQVTVVDLSNAAAVLQAEADENTCRKSLTPYEASRARERRAKVLAADADARRRQHGGTAPGRTNTSPNLGEVLTPKARETAKAAAVGTGYSGSTLDKVDRIRAAAERGVVRRGKDEVPLPEPVQAAAREALAQVKATGAAIEPASKKVDQAIRDFIEDDPDVNRARLRKSLWSAIRATSEGLPLLSPEHVADVIDDDLWDAIDRASTAVAEWAKQVDRLRERGLRVVQGGR